MKTTLLRAGALSCALMTTTCLTAPALAQTADTPPPLRLRVDENGVDLARGVHTLNVADIAIGPEGRGGLAYVRQFERSANRNVYDMGVFQGSGSSWTATFGLQSYAFSLSGTTYTATDGSGATLTKSGTTYTLTVPDGTVVTYANTTLVTGDSARKARATSIAYPTGEQIGLAWVSATYCSNNSDGCGTGVLRTAVRLQGVTSSLGYQLHLNYGGATAFDLADYGQWKRLDSISAINTTVDSCSPSAHSCTLTQSWPTVSYSGDDVTDPVNRTTRYTATGTTFAIRRPSSGSDNVVYTYTNGFISSVVRDGLTWGYNYSVSGSTATMVVTDPGSHTRTIVSNLTVGLPTSFTDELGHMTAYSYDGSGRLSRVTQPEGNYAEYTYNSHGDVTQVLRRDKANDSDNDIVTQAEYPGSCTPVTCGRPTIVRDALGNETEYAYDSTHGGVTSVTLPAPTSGAVRPQTRYTYSSLTAPGGGSVYRLTAVSECQTTSSCAGAADEVKTTIAYSQANLQPSSVSSGSGNGALTATTGIGYDSVARPITMDGPLGGSDDTVRTRYNAAGQVIGRIGPDPDGAGALKHRAERISYNSDGQVSKVETGTVDSQSDADWAAFAPLEEVRQEYDTSARPTVQRLVSGSTTYALTQTSYDGEGRAQCTAQRMNPAEFGSLPSDACTLDSEGGDGPDRITRATYDNANRVTRIETGYGVTGTVADEVTRTFTDNGLVMTLTDANGNTTTYSHDGQDRMVQVLLPTTSATLDYETYVYDANGNLTSVRQRDGNYIGMTYDALNRPIGKDLPGGESTVTYLYDNLGRLTSAAQPTGGWTLTYAYDALGRPLGETSYLGTVGYGYDAAGRRTSLTYPGSGLAIAYAYNTAGDLLSIVENPAGSNVTLATYAYDDRGRRTSLTRGNGLVTSYQYDAVDRLTQLAHNLNGTSNDLTLDFTYNPAGQIAANPRSNNAYSFVQANANVADTIDALNRVTATGVNSVSYGDARGNITAIGGTPAYGYTAENRLASAGGIGFGYDPVGRLAYSTADPQLTRFLYDGHSLIGEYDNGLGVLRRFVHGPGSDEPLVWYEGSGTSTRRYFHADERGSVIAVSDGAGDIVTGPNLYDEYGRPQGTHVSRFGYTGQLWLPEIAMSYYRARIYNPALGRFMQTDPIGYGDGMNMYAYVGNDPVNSTDPSGLGDRTDSKICTGTRLPCSPQNGPTPGVVSIPGFASFIEGGSRGPGRPGSTTETDGLITVTLGSAGLWIPGIFLSDLTLIQYGSVPHDFWLFSAVATREQCTAEEAQSGLSRHVVPGQDPSRPVTTTAREYPINIPGTAIEIGRVTSRFLPSGLGRNTTLPGHPFFLGVVDRGIVAIGRLWIVGTHGHGLNFGGTFVAAINQVVGPEAFRLEDARLGADLARTCTGGN